MEIGAMGGGSGGQQFRPAAPAPTDLDRQGIGANVGPGGCSVLRGPDVGYLSYPAGTQPDCCDHAHWWQEEFAILVASIGGTQRDNGGGDPIDGITG